MSESLNLFYNGELVGVLSEDDEERLSFSYDKSWPKTKGAFSISICLPLRVEPYGHINTKAFFENLIPEGEVRKTIESLSKRNVSDDFHFLKEFGVDCAGAFVLSHLSKPDRDKKLGLKEIKLDKIYEYLREKKPLTSTIMTEEGGRFSLAGAQDKLPVIYKSKKLFIPLNGEATTHILKPYVRYHKDTEDTPYNEYFCMKLAQKIGLNVPKPILIEGEFPLYLVERFDRENQNGEIKRIHQEDFCQAQGLTSRKKYEESRGPKLADNYKLIKNHSSLPIKDLSQFLKWFWFNLLIGNNDCHSKNLSFLHSKNGIRLSPFYDLLSTSIYKGLTSKFSYSIGNQFYWNKLKSNHFSILARELEIKEKLLFKEGKNVITSLEREIEESVRNFEVRFKKIKTAHKIKDEFNKRIKHITGNVKALNSGPL